MKNLWSTNTPASFWLCQPDIQEEQWRVVIQRALPVLGLSHQPESMEELLAFILGEGQFGLNHWQLSFPRRAYYAIKPLLLRSFTRALRKFHSPSARANFPLGWPIEDRYARFQWELIRQVLLITGNQSMTYCHFWPQSKQYAFALTHDVETENGQANIRLVADLEESLGFRSSFNFLPGCYALDHKLLQDLRERGFEIGVHGHLHNGKLFSSYKEFTRQAQYINGYLKDLDAVGFRSPLMMRNPEWMQELEFEYDLSFFDSDPYEPMPGGTMSIWPFIIGRFVELPCTLTQDSTLTMVLGETTPKLWLEKTEFIERYMGMVLMNTHPDYLSERITWKMYSDFLQAIRHRGGYWHALPMNIARWWRARSNAAPDLMQEDITFGKVQLTPNSVMVTLDKK